MYNICRRKKQDCAFVYFVVIISLVSCLSSNEVCFLTFQCQVDCVCIVQLVCGPCCFCCCCKFTLVYTVQLIGFGHFAVFLFFGEQAQNILMLIRHIAGLCENFIWTFFILWSNPDFFFSKCCTFVPVSMGIFLITSFSVNFASLLHHRHS